MKKVIFALLILVFTCSLSYAGQGWTAADLIAAMQLQTRGNLDVEDSLWYLSVNLGQEDMSTTTDCTVDTSLIILSSGTAIYSLPADCIKVRYIRDLGTGRALDIIQEGQEGKAGTGMEIEEPKIQWTTRGIEQATWYPAPSDADTVMLSYCKSPVVVDSDTNTVSIAPVFHTALVYACLEALFTRLERWDAATYWATKKINKINNIEIWLNRPGPDVTVGKRVIGRTE